MEIEPTADQLALIQRAIEAGRIGRPEDAAAEAMSLWEERERRRLEILSRVDAAEASLAAGQGIVITQESMRRLAAEVKQRGRDRLAAESAAGR
jgi:hypothetical protein